MVEAHVIHVEIEGSPGAVVGEFHPRDVGQVQRLQLGAGLLAHLRKGDLHQGPNARWRHKIHTIVIVIGDVRRHHPEAVRMAVPFEIKLQA